VDVVWLTHHLADVRVIDARRMSDYLGGHIPGAVSFALDTLLVEDTSAVALERLAGAARGALVARGVDSATHVVLTDDADGSASLGALVCELAGVARVSVLLGGVDAWAALGNEVESVPRPPAAIEPEDWLVEDPGPDTRSLVSFEELAHAVKTGSANIVDARSQLEHEGIVGAPCCADRGSIPGSVHLEWTALFGICGEPHSAERVREIATHLGLARDETIIFTCHAGHRAAVAARILRDAGFADVRVSLGSWHEWCTRVPRPANA